MDTSELLRRRYQRLLRAYPNWYRQERGLEILSTLLDASAPDQRQPSGADTLDILGRGLRCRFRVPRGTQYAYITVLALVFFAFAGSAAATLTYAAGVPTPGEAEVAAVAQLATGQAARNQPGPVVACDHSCRESWQPDGDQIVTFDDPFEENNGVDHVMVAYWTPASQVPTAVDDARSRLEAHGWQVGDLTVDEDGTLHFDAARDGLSLWLAGSPDGDGPALRLRFERELPARAPATVAGLVAGTLIGGPLTAWTLQRHHRHHGRTRTATTLCATPTLILMGFADLVHVQFVIAALLDGASSDPLAILAAVPPVVLSILQSFPVVRAGAAVSGALAVAALILTSLPLRARGREGTPTPAN
ncbi:hypothetical protein [Longispora urticae]